MVAFPKVESDDYIYTTNVYVKPKGSKTFVDLQNNYPLLSESIAKIYINKRKYEYEWFDVLLNPGDIIKNEIVRTYRTKDGLKNRNEVHYYLVKRNSKHIDENPFPLIAGDVYELVGDYSKIGEIENVVENKIRAIQR